MATRKKAKSKAKRKTTRVGGSISESEQIPDCLHLRRLPADAPPIARHGSLRHLGHEHLGNSLPTHLGDLEAPSLPDEVIAYDRYPAKPKNRKACQCMILAFGSPSDPEANEGLVGCHPAVNKEPAIASLNNFGFLPHIGNLTSDRLKEIGSGNYALDQAILVHDDRHPNRLGLEAIKCPENRHRFGKNQRLVDDRDRVERTAIYGLVEQI